MGICQSTAEEKKMTEQRTIAVFGATGAQGGSLVKALLAGGEFKIRALTRNTESEKAKAIAALSSDIELMQADLDDVASIEKAFSGCHGAYVVTNYWEHMDAAREVTQFENATAAAKSADLKHVVLSTFECSREIIKNKDEYKVFNDKYFVPHFDGKGEHSERLQAEIPSTLFYTSFYYENFIAFGMGPKKMSVDAPYGVTMPMGESKLTMVSVEDIGKMAAAIFSDASLIGKSVYVASDHLTVKEIADEFGKVMEEEVVYNAVPVDVYAGFGFPGAEELANMFKFYDEYADHFTSTRDLDEVKKLIEPKPFSVWLEENKAAFAG